MTASKIITIIGERDAKGRLWIIRETDGGRTSVVGRKHRSRAAAVKAAKRLGGKIQFWHG